MTQNPTPTPKVRDLEREAPKEGYERLGPGYVVPKEPIDGDGDDYSDKLDDDCYEGK